MKLILFILFASTVMIDVNAQSDKKIKAADYKFETDSLTLHKKNLTESKELLKREIDILKKSISSLDDKIQIAEEEIHELYYKKFGKENGKRIINKQVWKGMTEKMLMASWGKPDKIDKNVEKWGVFTQWYYGNATFFFRDGKLTDFEENK
ncbi:MAG: hypothetical protein AB1521_17840 [Bacteroidota bacterium]